MTSVLCLYSSAHGLLTKHGGLFYNSSIQAKLDVVYLWFSGPADYSPDVKSVSKLALIVSKEDRFKSPKNETPGPGAYEVGIAYIYVKCLCLCLCVCVCVYIYKYE